MPALCPILKGMNLGAWLTTWLKFIESTIEPRTHDGYAQHVNTHIRPRIGHMRLMKIRPADVEGFYQVLLNEGVSAGNARKIGTTLTIALNHATRTRLIPMKTAIGIKKPKAKKPDIEVLNPTQAATFAEACRADGAVHGALFLLLLDGGFRPGEAFALTWPDIDLAKGRVSITKALEERNGEYRVKVPKTGRSVRQVDISAGTVEALTRHRAKLLAAGSDVHTGLVFTAVRGGYLSRGNVRSNAFKPLLKAAGVPDVSLYALRHTCATLLLLADVNPKIVAERLGHSSITQTLDTYSHVLPTMQKAAADVIGKLLAKPVKKAAGS